MDLRIKIEANETAEEDDFKNSETSEKLNGLETCDSDLVAKFGDIKFGSEVGDGKH